MYLGKNGMSDITYSYEVVDQDLLLTPSAGAKMAELLSDADEDVRGVRLFVMGGGCSGMSYGMTFAESITEYDSTLRGNGYDIVIDAVALNYLKGCEIDFHQDSFVFKNVFQSVGGSGACGGCAGGNF